jgi:hypothetical protein
MSDEEKTEKKAPRDEFLCGLHSTHSCSFKRYDRDCNMREKNGFAKVACEYRLKAVILPDELAKEAEDE